VIPVDVLRRDVFGQRRDIMSVNKDTSGYTGDGDSLVETQLLTSSFVGLLRNRTILMQLARTIGGLQGKFEIPKQLSGASAMWLGGEDESPDDTDIRFGVIKMDPKTLATKGQITRSMLKEPSMDIEAVFRNDMAEAMAEELDLAGFYGAGTGGIPKGITLTDQIRVIDFAATQPTYDELVDMETEIEVTNVMGSNLVYLANRRFKGHAKKTKEDPSSTDATKIWKNGVVNELRCEITNQINTGDVILGDWSKMLIGMWGGIEILPDPYTFSDKARLRISMFQDVDFAVRRPEAFCLGRKLA